jgi:hypothetical protein
VIEACGGIVGQRIKRISGHGIEPAAIAALRSAGRKVNGSGGDRRAKAAGVSNKKRSEFRMTTAAGSEWSFDDAASR